MKNLSRVDLLRELASFRQRAKGAASAVIYYSGHGMINSRRQNHLLPVDMPKISANAGTDPDTELKASAVSEDELIDAVEGAAVQLVILDACRDNGFTSGRSGTKGLARRADMQRNRLIAYATEEGRIAQDGSGNNSPYARSLARHLAKTDAPLLKVFDDVADDVLQETNNTQYPTRSGNMRVDTYLVARLSADQAIKDCAACPELVVVPAGSLVMGSSAAEQSLANAAGIVVKYTSLESPQHKVSVRSFSAGRYAVTKGEFAAFVRAKSYQTEAELGDGCYGWVGTEWKTDKAKSWRNPGYTQADDHPVVCVSWNDAQAYTTWLSQTSGKIYRLLSEAEREFAARAGSQSAFWWGDGITTSQANYDGNYSYNGSPKGEYRQGTVPVNSFKANAYGLHNVHGNVWEWVEDVWHENYGGAPTDGSAWTTGGDTARRVLRGGSWVNIPGDLRSASRVRNSPGNRDSGTGFRIARTL